MARPAAPQPNLAPLMIAAGVLAAPIAIWYELPGIAVAWLGMIFAAWSVPPAVLTGKKDPNGYPTAASPQEEKARLAYSRASQYKWGLIAPNATWFPGWPPALMFFLAVAAAGVAVSLPVGALGEDWVAIFKTVNAIAAFVLIMQVGHVHRVLPKGLDLNLNDPQPALTVQHVAELFGAQRTRAIAMSITAGIGFALTFLVLSVLATKFRWALYTAPIPLYVLPISAAVAVAIVVLVLFVKSAALANWRALAETRTLWEPRWSMMKLSTPRVVAVEQVGDVPVVTFDAPTDIGGAAAMPKYLADLGLQMGAGEKLALLSSPNVGSDGAPVPGTIHPTRFRLATWVSDQLPDVLDPELDAEVRDLLINSAMAWVVESVGAGHGILMDIAPLHTTPEGEQSEPVTAAYVSSWEFSQGTNLTDFRTNSSFPLMEMLGDNLGVEVLIDHRAGVLFLGDLSGDSQNFTDQATTTTLTSLGMPMSAAKQMLSVNDPTGRTGRMLANLAAEDTWRRRWMNVVGQAPKIPRIEHLTYAEATINGNRIEKQSFQAPQGLSANDYFVLEKKLATALASPAFITITGFTGQGDRPGDRHPGAFTVIWSARPVPSSPGDLAPATHDSPASRDWLLAGRINHAFEAARLQRPEVYQAKPLTSPESDGHIWEISIRLHGGTTVADVRGQAERLRGSLGCEWLRVSDAEDGCTIVCGARPDSVTFATPRTPRLGRRRGSMEDTSIDAEENPYKRLCIALDWEQAFLSSKNVTGAGGSLPSLISTSTLPTNENVSRLEFRLPAGVDRSQIKAVTKKLSDTTGNDFVEVRASETGAGTFSLLVSRTNPLPFPAPFKFDAVDTSERMIPFATNVEGEDVLWDPIISPHALLAGVTRAGKSVMAQCFIYGLLSKGARVVIIDPMKGAADFKFAEQYVDAFATDIFQAAAVMKAVFEEILRRKNMNAAAGVGSYHELADPPPPLVIFVDEFTSLMGKDPVPAPSDDLEMEKEREEIIARNRAREELGTFIGKIAREAASAGANLLLGTQKLSAKMLDTFPNGQDLKTNLARSILGNSSPGDRMSALRNFDDVPPLGDTIPKGRGYWEPLDRAPFIIQTWFATQDDFRRELESRISAKPLDERIDFHRFLPEWMREEEESDSAPEEIIDLGLVEFDLADFDLSDGTAALPAPAVEESDPVPPDEFDLLADLEGLLPMPSATPSRLVLDPAQLPRGFDGITVVPDEFDDAETLDGDSIQALAAEHQMILVVSSWEAEATEAVRAALTEAGATVAVAYRQEWAHVDGWWQLAAVQHWLGEELPESITWHSDELDDAADFEEPNALQVTTALPEVAILTDR